MSIEITPDELTQVLTKLTPNWRVYAPKAEYRGGRFSDTDNIVYQPVSSWQEIVWQEKSHMSPRTVITPITETLFYFEKNTIQIAEVDTRPILIFARACDINAMSRLDQMYLYNGPGSDYNYQKIRQNIHFVLMECRESFENCFCVSMGTNQTDDYAAAIRFSETGAQVHIKNEILTPFFTGIGKPSDYQPSFVTHNREQVTLPEQVCDDPQKVRNILADHPIWDEYSRRCISCGRCSTGCPTCTCYSIFDVPYAENSQRGERRRQWASCMIPGFSDMAGGHHFRDQASQRMRYRALHKVNDFKERFGNEQMCVGCGRCDDRCPQYIKFSHIINKMTQAVQQAIAKENLS
ncbi:anaerobic sulfite reductase subunit AsrA [Celerinatantimonas diazotrophica]|uniref:Anaerobic sulfite reductase subunit A n=1 Tax=Celerinatantimonas diazotrophica TaxID=412034 RepID=A0A4R1J8L5_9GAMM|nr:anaerobic sulfite reductase subunit AsrA [Celerinatantimonas diazotrophica]TCK46935.1 anaerobic sulfite reductase subunit A [Celerinatantimonas diazotrophica]CAG9295703.1 Anaerobic sulfite reductase subunit A [Celerinatantimonas diazotrophica]